MERFVNEKAPDVSGAISITKTIKHMYTKPM
jgi:hypothetical protein